MKRKRKLSKAALMLPLLPGLGLLSYARATADGFNEPNDPSHTVLLWGNQSGFAKARLGVDGVRKSIVVGWLPGRDYEQTNAILDRHLDAWNRAAGWELFILSPDNEATDISWHINDTENLEYGGWAWPRQFSTGWYEHCDIYFHSWGPVLDSTYAHEPGHCLGFMDSIASESGYFGIMSYARRGDTTPDNPQDRASLEAAGYRGSL